MLGLALGSIWLNSYSNNIHPIVPVNYGGAKPYKLCITKTDKAIIYGDLIYQDHYYIKNKENIHFIQKTAVSFIKISNSDK